MKHTFTFHFSHGTTGLLRVMVIVDVFTVCRVCKDDGIQRYYRAVPFATLTAARFEAFVDGAPALASFLCPNCGTAVTRRCVHSGVAIYGFPGGEGQLRATFAADAGRVTDVSYEVLRRKANPQALPTVVIEDVRDVEPTPESEGLWRRAGRRFCLKSSWRALLADRSSDEVLVERVSKGCWIAAGPTAAAVIDGLDLDANTIAVPLGDAPAALEFARGVGLPQAALMPGAVSDWLDVGDAVAIAGVDLRELRKRFVATLESARMTADVDAHEGDLWITAIKSPRGVCFDGHVSLGAIAQLAVASGVAPRDMARYGAELIVADLLGIDLDEAATDPT